MVFLINIIKKILKDEKTIVYLFIIFVLIFYYKDINSFFLDEGFFNKRIKKKVKVCKRKLASRKKKVTKVVKEFIKDITKIVNIKDILN